MKFEWAQWEWLPVCEHHDHSLSLTQYACGTVTGEACKWKVFTAQWHCDAEGTAQGYTLPNEYHHGPSLTIGSKVWIHPGKNEPKDWDSWGEVIYRGLATSGRWMSWEGDTVRLKWEKWRPSTVLHCITALMGIGYVQGLSLWRWIWERYSHFPVHCINEVWVQWHPLVAILSSCHAICHQSE